MSPFVMVQVLMFSCHLLGEVQPQYLAPPGVNAIHLVGSGIILLVQVS